MNLFRICLSAFLGVLLFYTLIVVSEHGPNLIPIFLGELLALTWSGQFNLDFMGFLLLSAAWVLWRNRFTPVSIVLALAAFLGGMIFLTIYLLFLSFKTDGNIVRVMLGEERVHD